MFLSARRFVPLKTTFQATAIPSPEPQGLETLPVRLWRECFELEHVVQDQDVLERLVAGRGETFLLAQPPPRDHGEISLMYAVSVAATAVGSLTRSV